ncbi:MAG TPA: hypothetical protein VM734_35080, partial [Kofleriaceae bacterium]|nr:hypothetical protein [Kofleriaceae bacterium]
MRLPSHLDPTLAAVATAAAAAGALAARLGGGHGVASRLAVGTGLTILVVLALRAGVEALASADDLAGLDTDPDVRPRGRDDLLVLRTIPFLAVLV